MIREEFRGYLLARGYLENAPRGGVNDYMARIEKVCVWEKLSWEELGGRIYGLLAKYGKADRFSANAFVRALKRFEEFLKEKTAQVGQKS